jgi:hypothetical protein
METRLSNTTRQPTAGFSPNFLCRLLHTSNASLFLQQVMPQVFIIATRSTTATQISTITVNLACGQTHTISPTTYSLMGRDLLLAPRFVPSTGQRCWSGLPPHNNASNRALTSSPCCRQILTVQRLLPQARQITSLTLETMS